MARKHKLAAAVFSVGCLQAGSVMALGLGEMELQSFLNEPLKASVDLLNLQGLHADQIKIRLGSTEDFEKLGLDRPYFLTSLTFSVSVDGNGGPRIIVSSEGPVLEPYLDFIVEARWPTGRLLREYTVLIDPPVFSQATPVVSASQRVEEVEGSQAPSKKNDEVATSGTRVGLFNSDLAPGAMPERDYNAASSPSPAPGTRYMIGRDQTLWKIASQAKPEGASVHQTMLDIQRLNPDAFINGNINRIKAGYIIYLPSAADISSADVSSALAEVQEQNAAWREGRDAQLNASRGPSLRISAEPEEEADTVRDGGTGTGSEDPSAEAASEPAISTVLEGAESVSLESTDAQERLAAAEEQLQTLQRIVSLKDDQIAALQSALADAGVDAVENVVDPSTQAAPAEIIADVEESQGAPTITDEPAAEVVEVEVVEEEVLSEAPQPMPAKLPETETAGGLMDYLFYILGALILAVAGFVIAKRRGSDNDETTPERPTLPADDAFSGVQLRDQGIEVEAPLEDADESWGAKRDNRGYGERKHDEYASDVDAADALAEADIYIAYGRHPQAIELLNNALAVEPGNPVYRLKLLEIYVERNNYGAATAQLEKLKAGGDPDSIARAESLMEGIIEEDKRKPPEASVLKPGSGGPGLPPNPLSMMPDSSESLEADFSGLEIEGLGVSGDVEGDLDLSSDFAPGRADGFEDEELVIAADSSGLSTKLDLARAYLDMGDDDGARQILEEVIAEGTGELKVEARALLDRIGG